MTNILLFVSIAFLVAVVVLLLIILRKSSQADAPVLASRLDAFEKAQVLTADYNRPYWFIMVICCFLKAKVTGSKIH